jgi:Gpi18-like mannosyltransferase
LRSASSHHSRRPLAWTLWDGWIAGFFAVLNFDWLQRSYLGGSEPLFVALLFGSFLSVRKERWLLAAFLASLATVVRPLGIFALLGIGVALLIRRDWRTLRAAILIGTVVGGLYVLPLTRHFNDPLANVNSYHSPQWQGGWLFGIPFYAIIKGTLTEPAPLSNLVLSFGWILLILVAIVRMARDCEFSQLRARPRG